jgi:PEP-CTERM motif
MNNKLRALHAIAALCLVLGATSARATASLEVWLSDFACAFTDETGLTTGIPCNGSRVTVGLGPGDSVMITANLHYVYQDDGLAIAEPRTAGIQMDANGFSMLFATHEVGWIYVYGARCDSRYCPHPPGLNELGTATFPPILLGLNDVADDLSGQLQVSAGYSVDPGLFFGSSPTASLSVFGLTHSVTAPIPEPGTYALMLFGLGAIGVGTWRRRVR